MYEIRVNTHFLADHQIRIPNGFLEPIHGHEWKIEAVFRGPKLDEVGILVDFTLIEKSLKEIIAPFENSIMNNVPALEGQNPTAENIARYIFIQLQKNLENNVSLAAVYVMEAPGCIAGYLESSL